jgi:RecA-family ATPase
MNGAIGTHFNGLADAHLKDVAEELRGLHQRANGHDPNGHHPWLHELEPIEALDFATLADRPSIQRAWAVPDWFPVLETTGFGGPGGTGKTLLAQTFGTAAALGASALGMPFEQLNACLVLCEDRHDDAYLRQADINRYFGCKMKDLAGRLKILPRRKNKHNYLGIFDDNTGLLHTTSFFDQLLEELKSSGSRFTVLDTRGDIFWGNQNDERHARRFVRDVTDRLAEETEGLVVLLYQPSRAGRTDGTGESGSAQWDAAFRCRCLLEAAQKDDDPRTRRLIRKKSNFSASDVQIEIRWKEGIFLRAEEEDAKTPSFEVAAKRAKAERVFLSSLDYFTEKNLSASPSPNSINYAPKRFAQDKQRAEGCTKDELEAAMNRLLFDQSKIAIKKASKSRWLEKG